MPAIRKYSPLVGSIIAENRFTIPISQSGLIMSNIEINRVLGQIRLMQDQIRSTTIPAQTDPAVDFGSVLKGAIDTVNGHQQYAGQLARAFERGDPGINLSDVMIAGQKSGLAFQSMLQARNKLVDAYKDVMNMPM